MKMGKTLKHKVLILNMRWRNKVSSRQTVNKTLQQNIYLSSIMVDDKTNNFIATFVMYS